MIIGACIALGLGLTALGLFGTMGAAMEYHVDKKIVVSFMGMFLLGLVLLGGGLGSTA